MTTHPALTVYDAAANECIRTDFVIEKPDGSIFFAEGPIWNGAGYYLFSDIPRNLIYKLTPGLPKQIFLNESGYSGRRDRADLSGQIGSNGLTYDNENTLLICQHGNGAVAKKKGSKAEPFLSAFNGKPFNSPNDIVVHKDGTVFFSDPPYGLKNQKLQPEKYQPLAGVYVRRDGETKLITDRYQYPNGVCLSPDDETLYTCSHKPFEKFVLAFDARTLALKGTVCEENSDGIKCDKRGNLYLCTKEGVVIVSTQGKRLAKIELETEPANCCWGGREQNDLFITARQNVFLIRDLQKNF